MSSHHPDPTEEIPHYLDGKLEPEMKNSTDERAVFYSIAISLKRIADALDSETGPHLSIREAVSQVAYKHGINSR